MNTEWENIIKKMYVGGGLSSTVERTRQLINFHTKTKDSMNVKLVSMLKDALLDAEYLLKKYEEIDRYFEKEF